jgi:hypothetical protein
MHPNLSRRFRRLVVTEGTYNVALLAFKARYALLFDALAAQLGISRMKLAKKVGFDPVPKGGNAVMNGEVEPSNEDVAKLLALWEDER